MNPTRYVIDFFQYPFKICFPTCASLLNCKSMGRGNLICKKTWEGGSVGGYGQKSSDVAPPSCQVDFPKNRFLLNQVYCRVFATYMSAA